MRGEAAITLVSATLAGVFIYYSRPISRQFVSWMNGPATAEASSNNSIALATIANLGGSVVIRRLDGQAESSYKAQAQSALYHLDQILVDRAASADLAFPSGYRIRLLPGTEATIQSYRPKQAGAPLLITLTSGDYQLLARGTGGLLFVAMNDQIFAPEFRPAPAAIVAQPPVIVAQPPAIVAQPSAATLPAQAKPNASTAVVLAAAPDKLMVAGRETLSNQYIERVIRDRAGAFQHCQMNSIRDNHASEGSLLFNMTISPAGQIAHLQVLQDMLNNKELLECTRSVLERLQFEPFNGDPMTVNYPINYR